MSFKNSLKVLVSRFGLVWSVLLYLAVFGIIIASLSLSFLVPIIRALTEAGIFKQIEAAYQALLGGASLSEIFGMIGEIGKNLLNIYRTDKMVIVNSTLLISLVWVLVSRFLLGFYEIPLVAALEGRMSSKARLSYSGCLISDFKLSVKFVPVKMLYTIIVDGIGVAALYGLYILLAGRVSIFLPFILMLFHVLYTALRYSVKALWTPAVVVGGKKVFEGLRYSARQSFKYFGIIYSLFFVAWIFIYALNILIGVLTLGVGLILTVPMCMVFMSIVDMTLYYKINEKRYYLDDNTVTPPLNPDNLEEERPNGEAM